MMPPLDVLERGGVGAKQADKAKAQRDIGEIVHKSLLLSLEGSMRPIDLRVR